MSTVYYLYIEFYISHNYLVNPSLTAENLMADVKKQRQQYKLGITVLRWYMIQVLYKSIKILSSISNGLKEAKVVVFQLIYT